MHRQARRQHHPALLAPAAPAAPAAVASSALPILPSRLHQTAARNPQQQPRLRGHSSAHPLQEGVAFFSSAATDLVTAKANRAVFDRVWWPPRVLRSVRDVNTRTRILG